MLRGFNLTIVACGFLMLCGTTAQAQIGPDWFVERPVTTSSGFETTPRLGNDGASEYVTYTHRPVEAGGALGAGDIWLQWLDEGKPVGPAVPITTSPTDDQLNDCSGDWIVYTKYDSVTSSSGAIVVHQISTGAETGLTYQSIIQEPKIDGVHVLWRAGGAFAAQVIYYNLNWIGTGNSPVAIAGPIPPTFDVEIGSEYVVWAELDGGTYSVHAMELATGDVSVVADVPTLNDRQPCTDGPWIAWERRDGLESVIRVLNMDTLDTFDASSTNTGNAYNPTMSGERIAYMLDTGESLDIYCSDLAGPNLVARFRVTESTEDEYLSDILGTTFAYVDMASGSEDVYVTVPTKFRWSLSRYRQAFEPVDGSCEFSLTLSMTQNTTFYPPPYIESEAFRVGLDYDTALLDIVDVGPHAQLLSLHGGLGPDHLVVDFLPTGPADLTVEAIYDLTPPFETLPFWPSGQMLLLDFVGNPTVLTGQLSTIESTIGRSDVNLANPLENTVIVDGVDEEITFRDLAFRLIPHRFDLRMHAPSRVLYEEDGVADFTVLMTLEENSDSPGFPNPVGGIFFGWLIPPVADGDLNLVSYEPAGVLAALHGGMGPEGWDTYVFTGPDGPAWTIQTYFGHFPFVTIPFDGEFAIAELQLETRVEDYAGDTSGRTIEFAWGNENFVTLGEFVDEASARGFGTTVDIQPIVFARGDCNTDALTDIADPVFLLGYLFGPGLISCEDACDANDDGLLDIGDAVSLFSYLFSGGPAPAAPFPACGFDSTGDALECDAHAACGY